MGEAATTAESFGRFTGMMSVQDPEDVQPGQAVVQVNVTGVRPGELNVRRGLLQLSFEAEE